ncbi:MAG TPA: glycerophosphodiester phosphodiesterase [Acidimicrobiales bacterium]|nr:glycerophosphodiester phosphodiesterase [Acidimicrobiales bacterium]
MPLVIGHRGAPRAAHENTVDAFRAAAAAGADMVELDVRCTADGGLVVHHDATLGDGRPIVELDVAALPSWLPSLDEAFDACDGMSVNVEIKERDAARGVVALIAARALHQRVIVSSFDFATIADVKAADARIPTAWLTFAPVDDVAAKVAGAGHQAIHPHDATVTPQLVDDAHRHGLAINVWTVDDVDRMRELASWGVDGIVTNVPDAAVAALRPTA